MDFPQDGAAMKWPDDTSMISEDGTGVMLGRSPSPAEASWMICASTTQMQAGQLSPVSTAMDMTTEASPQPTILASTSSPRADSWSPLCSTQNEAESEMTWEQSADDILAIPKLEPIDDDFNLDDFHPAPMESLPEAEPATVTPKPKRPRGRPRKHPAASATASTGKVTKGRSKTGCITCRKRKKKCDEAKPRCMNCEKNAVVCEGYHEKQIWKSGKEKAAEDRMKLSSLPMISLPPLFHGVETQEDMLVWKHYVNHLSNVLTVEGEAKNAFKDIILQLATKDQGLMHSVLSLSSKHIDLDTPYGMKLQAAYPQTTAALLSERSEHHHISAMQYFRGDFHVLDDKDPGYKTTLCAHYGQMLCLFLKNLVEGNPRGEHRMHLRTFKKFSVERPLKENSYFRSFIDEFFQYHIFADDLLWHPGLGVERLASEDWKPFQPIEPPRLLGVGDGLLNYLARITTIRNTIRANRAASVDPVVDYHSLYQAAEVDEAIKRWAPDWPPGDNRETVGLIYRNALWLYLCRTIYPPTTPPIRRSTVSAFPVSPPPSAGCSRRASMAATISMAKASMGGLGGPSFSSMQAQSSEMPRGIMPKPPAFPSHMPHKIEQCSASFLEHTIGQIESFKPSDPVQTLLLIPCLLLGTLCTSKTQQQRVTVCIRTVRGYTGLRNSDRVVELLQKIWELMDQGDWDSVWDWQETARRLQLDFLCA